MDDRRRPAGDLGPGGLGHYDRLVAEWWRPSGAFAMLHWLAAARAALVPPPSRPGALLVDLGCGAGLLAASLTGDRAGYRHVGVDLTASALPLARRAGVIPLRGDAARAPLRAGTADVVVAGELLEHVPDPDRVVAEAARLLHTGGVLVADTIAAGRLPTLVAVTLGERIGLAPRGIHDPALFVPPSRLLAACRRHGLRAELRGLRPAAGPLLRFLATRRGAVPLRPTRRISVLYQLRAVKEDAPPGP